MGNVAAFFLFQKRLDDYRISVFLIWTDYRLAFLSSWPSWLPVQPKLKLRGGGGETLVFFFSLHTNIPSNETEAEELQRDSRNPAALQKLIRSSSMRRSLLGNKLLRKSPCLTQFSHNVQLSGIWWLDHAGYLSIQFTVRLHKLGWCPLWLCALDQVPESSAVHHSLQQMCELGWTEMLKQPWNKQSQVPCRVSSAQTCTAAMSAMTTGSPRNYIHFQGSAAAHYSSWADSVGSFGSTYSWPPAALQ